MRHIYNEGGMKVKSSARIGLFVFAAAAAALVSLQGRALAAPALTADQVIQKTVDTYNKLDSYKMADYKYGYDTFSKDRQKEMTSAYKDMAKQQGVNADAGKPVSRKPEIKQGSYEVIFKKPYMMRMTILKSDYVPDFVIGSVLTYNTSKNAKQWEAKLKSIPVAIKRSVAKDDSGGFLEMGWAFAIMSMQNIKAAGSAKLAGQEKVNGINCYVIEVKFTPAQWSKFKPISPDLKKLGVPQELNKVLTSNTLPTPGKEKYSSVKYWIDSSRFLLIRSEEYIDGKFYWRNEYRNIVLNKQTASDFK